MVTAGVRGFAPALSAGAGMLLATVVVAVVAVGSVEAQVSRPEPEYTGADRIEEWSGRRILVVTPHPDDETFTSGGTLAILAANGNDIRVVVYTTDNAGSRDPEMTKDRLKAIRRAEEEEACRILGIPKENIVWLGHDDGMLEYVDRRDLTRQVAREIRRFKPDALFSVDPGSPYEQYHKSDHRSGAIITVDAIRAARWRLYFPELEAEGFEAWSVPLVFFYYSANPNYTVDITAVAGKKARASAAHISQFGSMVDRYDPQAVDEQRKEWAARLLARAERENGKVVERFRRSTAY
ncbi:MAG: PIG-L family deacetylase [Holophagales bacterium]|nr:PIG-L family deacetylase [Holophagales bacterium]